MVKLNRTTEYGLMAISYIRSKGEGEVASAREISDHFKLPFEILAKTLQKLKDQGIISSSYGTRGGYVLARDLRTLALAEFLNMMEGPLSVVACAHEDFGSSDEGHKKAAATPNNGSSRLRGDGGCEYLSQCSIKQMMSNLNSRIYEFMNRISIDELTRNQLLEAPQKNLNIAAKPKSSFSFSGEEP